MVEGLHYARKMIEVEPLSFGGVVGEETAQNETVGEVCYYTVRLCSACCRARAVTLSKERRFFCDWSTSPHRIHCGTVQPTRHHKATPNH